MHSTNYFDTFIAVAYGWGVHANGEGKLALYGIESRDYRQFLDNHKIKKVKAMRSKRA